MQHSETVLQGNSTVGLKLKTMHNVRTFLAFKSQKFQILSILILLPSLSHTRIAKA